MITQEEMDRIEGYQKSQDQNAYILGVATVEWQERMMQIMSGIRRIREEQKRAGEDILKAHGLDPDKENLDISPNGYIRKLIVIGGEALYVDPETNEVLK